MVSRVKTVCYDEGTISPYSDIAYFTTLPLREGETRESINVFPNPSNGVFTIELNGYENANVNTVIINAVGQVVYENTSTPAAYNFTLPVNLNGVPTGIYYVTSSCNGKIVTNTILID
ncbi:MAG: T9SS type A sorting domain-containing protein [Bacteroidetes bacterium]|nr:T9SS type A sorting domain-containing protein [Bacteroidota bacterium]